METETAFDRKEKCTTFNFDDLCVIAGKNDDVSPSGVLLYRSPNDSAPSRSMTPDDFRACFQQGTPSLVLPYHIIRQVLVNGNPVWQNPASFKTPDDQMFYGRGYTRLELYHQNGVRSVVEAIIASKIVF